jgi:O-antigen/teichoic acid export membrane protein
MLSSEKLHAEHSIRFLPPDKVHSADSSGLLFVGMRRDLSLSKTLAAKLGNALRLRSLNMLLPNERARERHRRVAYTIGASILAGAITLGTTLITMRLALSYLGTERFGLWMTITTLQAFLVFADLGVGNGLLNAVAEANGKSDTTMLREYIDSGMLLLGLISGFILLLLAGVYRVVPFGQFLNLHSPLALGEVKPAIAVFVACFAIDVFLGLVQRVQFGLQLGFLIKLWQIAGSALGLAGVLTAMRLRAGLPVLVLALCGAPLVAKLLNGYLFFGRMRPDLRPTFKLISWSAMRKIGRPAFLFFVLQAAVGLAYQSDNLIISHVLSPEAVTQYSVPQRLFSLISLVIATLTWPLWPAYGEAVARGDGDWVKRTLSRSLIGVVGLAALMAGALVLLGPKLIYIWVGNKVHPSLMLLMGLACWTVVDAGGNAIAMFLNGTSVVKAQTIIASIFAVCVVVVKICVVHQWGINAMPWATLTSYIFLTALPYGIVVPRIASRICYPEPTSAVPVRGCA